MSTGRIPYVRLKPKNIDAKAWKEIVTAWENGLSDREASFRASRDSDVYITETQIKEMVAKSPDIASLRDFLLTDIVSKAKMNIADNIRDGNISTSKWYLERKAADEFSSKAAVAFEGAVIGLTMEEKQAEIDKLLENFGMEPKEGESDGPNEV